MKSAMPGHMYATERETSSTNGHNSRISLLKIAVAELPEFNTDE